MQWEVYKRFKVVICPRVLAWILAALLAHNSPDIIAAILSHH